MAEVFAEESRSGALVAGILAALAVPKMRWSTV